MPELNIQSALICPFENQEFSPAEIKSKIQKKQQLIKDLNIPKLSNVLINNINSSDFLITLIACIYEKLVIYPSDLKKAGPYLDQTIHDYQIHYIYDGQFQRTTVAEQSHWAKKSHLVMFSSGTTGLPKGIPLGLEHIQNRIHAFQNKYSEHVQHALNFLPTSFGHGLIANTLFPLASSRTLVLTQKFDITVALQLADLIDRHKITYFSSVPSVWNLLDKTKAPAPQNRSLKQVHCASAFLHEGTFQFACQWISPSAEFIINYGLTECGSWVTSTGNLNGCKSYKSGYVGSAIDCEITVDSTEADGSGEVMIKSSSIPEHYINPGLAQNPIMTQGYLKTGDIGYSVNDQIYLVGRKSEFINVGGYKVSPHIIESTALRFKGILAAAAISRPHPILGEQIALIIETSNSVFNIDELRTFLSSELTEHLVPKIIETIHQMPLLSNGKINRKVLF